MSAHRRAAVPARARASWRALGTNVELRLTDARGLAGARQAARRELEAIDAACSRFRADSELSRVNRAEGRPVRVGALLIEALELALRAARVTGGAVDPTIGRALELAGYDRDFSLLCPRGDGERPTGATPQADGHATPAPTRARGGAIPAPTRARGGAAPKLLIGARAGWHAVAIDRRLLSVRVPRGVKLDLGATAKAWAADRAAGAAAETAGCGALVSVGGDVATCGPAPAQGWRVRVTDDHRAGPRAPGQTVAVSDGGIATSSTAVRRWQLDGRPMHHIVDPRSGLPAVTVWRTASVAAATCAEANIASTATLLLGADAGAWLEQLGLPARLVGHDGRAHRVGTWPAPAATAQAAAAAAAGAGAAPPSAPGSCGA
ncbi:MAG TPA: FAD:protein FMN transferase [Solirubrobacteraceae bacterium]|nr:FAD:protein FMN transferase [Solirubrobacteraceae bacterium]